MFGDEIIPTKSPRWIPILEQLKIYLRIAHRPAHRRFPLGLKHVFMVFN